jgi:hypothetical protein
MSLRSSLTNATLWIDYLSWLRTTPTSVSSQAIRMWNDRAMPDVPGNEANIRFSINDIDDRLKYLCISMQSRKLMMKFELIKS